MQGMPEIQKQSWDMTHFSSGLIMEMKMEITGNILFFNLQDLHNFTPTPPKITLLLRIHRNNF